MKVYHKQNNAYIGECIDLKGILHIGNKCLVKVLNSEFQSWRVADSNLTVFLSKADLRRIGLCEDDRCFCFYKENVIIAQKILETE